MQNVATILVHSSEIFFGGFKKLLEGSRYSVAWRRDLDGGLPNRFGAGRKQRLVVIGDCAAPSLVAAIGRILEAAPDARIVLLGNGFSLTDVACALRSGAHGHLDDSVRAEDVANALDVIMSGATVLPARFAIESRLFDRAAALDAASRRAEAATASAATPLSLKSVAALRQDLGPDVRSGEGAASGADVETDGDFAADDVWAVASDGAAAADSDRDADSNLEAEDLDEPAGVRADAGAPAEDRFGAAPARVEAREAHAPDAPLSWREAEILQCLMRGESNKEIARNLEMAETTVKVHLKAITRKIRVRNRTQAAIWAERRFGGGATRRVSGGTNGAPRPLAAE